MESAVYRPARCQKSGKVHWQHAWRKGDTNTTDQQRPERGKGQLRGGLLLLEQTQAVTLRCWRPLRLTERFWFLADNRDAGISTALVGDS